MAEKLISDCPECDSINRRDFGTMLTGLAGAAAVGTALPAIARAQQTATAPAQAAREPKPAEDLIRELFATLSNDQKAKVVKPWTHEWRKGMYNAAQGERVGQAYTAAQQELVERILKAICNGEDGYNKITKNKGFDGSRNIQGCGAYIFGDPTGTNQFACVIMGHHMTIRCDGNSEPGTAWGGPMYYGHSADGASVRNVYNFQTQAVKTVFDALTEQQRAKAVIDGNNPGEGEASVRFRKENYPGLVAADLTAEQKRLVETALRTILNPYRAADADEVMAILRHNGGLDKIHLAFYKDRGDTSNANWNFWRLEGPGFVWNYRVLPHVHTFVNIAQV